MRPRTIQFLASVLLGVVVIGILALGEAHATAPPSSASPDQHAAILTTGPTVTMAPARPAHPDVLLPVAVVAAVAHLAPWPTPRLPARLDQPPQPKAPLYLRELVLLL